MVHIDKLGELLQYSLNDKVFRIYEKDADNIDMKDIERCADELTQALEITNLPNQDEAFFYVNPLCPTSLRIGFQDWELRKPFAVGSKVELIFD